MLKVLYPDSGGQFEDAAILRNAVYFSTALRAYSARQILQQPMGVDRETLAFLVLRAFGEFMTSTEDMIGWLFALKVWQPGNAEFSLFLLLDRIQVGRKSKKGDSDYTEKRAFGLLTDCNEVEFRSLLHIPSDEELLESGRPSEEVDHITRSMPFKLDGWRRMTVRRMEQDRGWVQAFNKIKHHALAFPTRERGKDEIWLPARIRPDYRRHRIGLAKAWLDISMDNARRLAGDAVAAQAVLHDTLAVILTTRYGEKYSLPEWVLRAYRSDWLLREA